MESLRISHQVHKQRGMGEGRRDEYTPTTNNSVDDKNLITSNRQKLIPNSSSLDFLDFEPLCKRFRCFLRILLIVFDFILHLNRSEKYS